MRGRKVKTMRAVAREAGLPAENAYRVKIHKKAVVNPAYGTVAGVPAFIVVPRRQVVLGRCQRKMVQYLKAVCPKNTFFGTSIAYFRSGGRQGLPTVYGGPEAQE